MGDVCQFVLFPDEGERKAGRTEQTLRGSSSSFDGRALGCFSSAATVSAGKVNTHSQDCLRTSASSV